MTLEAACHDGPVKMEPRSDFRQAAAAAREVFVAMVDAGFTEAQAMQVVLAILTRPA